ncbi:hypothetical protein DEU56DRAFT_951211 [Suillus clintonianus]|uniref:uncharacterized protein n=1 Tax=Suillus clintonianus TaxID=1904413 RepID=UPI001B87F91E|nr:uncharacterized protein DEU56DRAFT_951211 [Suillus clintonianus]KAG2153823.1 hypothetical protein DEU56DRAFT_951211 [Suillus clintonianus]
MLSGTLQLLEVIDRGKPLPMVRHYQPGTLKLLSELLMALHVDLTPVIPFIRRERRLLQQTLNIVFFGATPPQESEEGITAILAKNGTYYSAIASLFALLSLLRSFAPRLFVSLFSATSLLLAGNPSSPPPPFKEVETPIGPSLLTPEQTERESLRGEFLMRELKQLEMLVMKAESGTGRGKSKRIECGQAEWD